MRIGILVMARMYVVTEINSVRTDYVMMGIYVIMRNLRQQE
jgi:hypothetical protein